MAVWMPFMVAELNFSGAVLTFTLLVLTGVVEILPFHCDAVDAGGDNADCNGGHADYNGDDADYIGDTLTTMATVLTILAGLQQEAAEPGMYPPIASTRPPIVLRIATRCPRLTADILLPGGSKGIKKSSVQTAQLCGCVAGM
eukprot:2837615-Rhodomonas_salina.2